MDRSGLRGVASPDMDLVRQRRGLCLLYFLSGAPGLAAQMAWTRVFGALLGHEWPALVGVVSAFFAGLAAGAWGLDRWVSRSASPLRWYAALELFSAGWILAGVVVWEFLVETLRGWSGLEIPGAARLAVAFLVPLVVVGPAAAAMGATLPAMDRALAPALTGGGAVGRLYAWNTAGAVLGVWGAVGWSMPQWGFRRTLLGAAAVQVACALGAWWWLGRRSTPGREEARLGADPGVPPVGDGRRRGWGMGFVFVLGWLGMGYELLGLRVLAQTTENTVHTFGAVLSAWLAGTALGAGWAGRGGRHGTASEPPLRRGAGILALVILGELALSRWHGALLAGWRSGGGGWGAELGLALLMFLPPTVLMGMLYVWTVQAARGPTGGVGRAVAWNALGAALAGPVWMAGFLPWLGSAGTITLVAGGYLASGFLLGGSRRGRSAGPAPAPRWSWPVDGGMAGAFGLLALILGGLRWPAWELPDGATVLRREEGFQATVAVVRTGDGHRSLRVNHHFQQGGTATAVAAARHAHLPLLLHPGPRRALFLGVGTGITWGSAAGHPGLRADGVELLPEVVRALPYFEPENGGPQRREGFRIFVADARRYARGAPDRYDVVVADLFHPSEDGAGFLYTREHFAALRKRLAEGGVICQWLPLHQMDLGVFRDVTATFRSVFPGASLWLLRFNVDVPVVGLMARQDGSDVAVDPAALESRVWGAGLREILRPAALTDAVRVMGCRLAGPASLGRLGTGGVVATDDLPRVLYRAAGTVYRPRELPASRLAALLGEAEPGFEEWLGLTGQGEWKRRLASFRRARDHHLLGLAWDAEGRRAEAVRAYLESAAEGTEYTGGYAQAVMVASAYATTDPEYARRILETLVRTRPEQRLAGEVLRRLPPATGGGGDGGPARRSMPGDDVSP